VHDYVIDARSGALVAETCRAPRALRHGTAAPDDLGNMQIQYRNEGASGDARCRLNMKPRSPLRDPLDGTLPGKLVKHPWSPAAVQRPYPCRCRHDLSAQVLKAQQHRHMGGRVVSTVNASSSSSSGPPAARSG